MSIRECIEYVLENYLAASKENFVQHPTAKFLRSNFPNAVSEGLPNKDRLIFKGSAGQGVWAKGPWIGIFDPLVTTTPQRGYYPVYLFREDMAGVYLSLNQGMTEAKKLYKADAKTALKARSENYRAILGNQISLFPELIIDLFPSSFSNDTAFYEAGNICAKYYPLQKIPSEPELVEDLSKITSLYQSLIELETGAENNNEDLSNEFYVSQHEEDGTKFRLHKRIERNSTLIKDVKKLQGCVCKVCGVDFEKRYGSIGKGFIEAHHLRPVSTLKGQKVLMDPVKDFAVLCSNCHRMIHRSNCLDNIEKFKANYFLESDQKSQF
jgi:5-methylcytosine-specific restriction protein A